MAQVLILFLIKMKIISFFIDYISTKELKEKFSHNNANDLNKIPEIDFIWDSRELPEIVKNQVPFDFIIASHVLEHIPDIISLFKSLRDILCEGGLVSLIIPDKRQTFDCKKNLTNTAQVIEAHLFKRKRHSTLNVLDHFFESVLLNNDPSWSNGTSFEQLKRVFDDQSALKAGKDSIESEKYIDIHCGIFTTSSFLQILRKISELELFDFEIVDFYSNYPGTAEFFVTLKSIPDTAFNNNETKLEAQLKKIDFYLEKLVTEKSANDLKLDNYLLGYNIDTYNTNLNQVGEDALRVHINKLETKLSSIKNSKYWSVTSPIRSIYKVLGKKFW